MIKLIISIEVLTIILIMSIIFISKVYSIIFIMLIMLCMQADWHVPYRVSVQKQDWQPDYGDRKAHSIVHSPSEVVNYANPLKGSCDGPKP